MMALNDGFAAIHDDDGYKTCGGCHSSGSFQNFPKRFSNNPPADMNTFMNNAIAISKCNECHKHGARKDETAVDFHHGSGVRSF
jgi:hypothetical protein